MRSLALVITQGTSVLTFYRGILHSSATSAAYEDLLDVSSIRVVANTPQLVGLSSRQAPTIKVTINNKNHRFFKILRLPFRQPAKIVDANGVTLFEGKIRSITYGLVVSLELSK